ncbi:hypothetical protein B0H14DRAFT_3453499 [Mycena olivaceomarginata]|nr:hypothetical protein B0H14DRAFT_3453499 [Mycena olivaceomarginata]
MPTKKSLQAARQRRKELDTSSTQPQTPSEATALSSPRSDVPALEFPISPTPMEPPSDKEEFPASVAVPVRTRQSTKRKSAVTSDISDAELARPAKKKARTETKEDVESDEEDIEIVTPATVAPKIVFMIPEAATEGNQRVSIKSSASFDDAIELMHETIGCVAVERKPTLAYKFSTANKTASTINLRTETDWEGLMTDVLAKMKTKKDISINISCFPRM